jgi:hypothetical protein
MCRKDLVMAYDVRYYNKVHKKILPRWSSPYQILKVCKSNNTYTLKNSDNLPYLYMVNHNKLKIIYIDD